LPGYDLEWHVFYICLHCFIREAAAYQPSGRYRVIMC
jgi:hypothetical protein